MSNNKRELRIEISVQYGISEWNMAEVVQAFRDLAKKHLGDPDIQITDEAADDRPYKMICPNCDYILSGPLFVRGDGNESD